METKQTNLNAELWDGTLEPIATCLKNLTIQMGEASITAPPYVVDWIAYGIVLGKTWLSKAKLLIDWNSNRMLPKQSERLIALDAEAFNHMVSQPSYIITSKQLKSLAKKEKSEIYHVIIKSIKENQERTQRKPDASHHSEELRDSLCKFQEIFRKEPPGGLPPKRVVQMNIDLQNDAKPKMGPIYKLSRLKPEEMKKQIEELLANEFISPSKTPRGSPALFTPKENGGIRMCIDYRALNKQTIKNQVVLPRIDDVWDRVGGAKYFSTIDLRSGSHQIRLRETGISKTAFRTRHEQFGFLVTPFGLTGAPSCFETLMNIIFRPYLDKFTLVYLDDALIYSETKEEHINHLNIVLNILKKHSLFAELSKCDFMKNNIEYLGNIITDDGIQVNPEKIQAVKNWEAPQNMKKVQRFLGLCKYYRRFVKDFATITTTLTNLTRKDIPFSGDKLRRKPLGFSRQS